MDKRTIREAGRKKAVRDRVWERRQEQPCRKSGTIMRQAGRYRAIDTAKKQVNEARNALTPEPDQEPYTATDKVETVAANSVYAAMNIALCKPTPQQLMRREAVKDYKRRRSQANKNPFHDETDNPGYADTTITPDIQETPSADPLRRPQRPAPQRETKHISEAHPSIHPSTGQRPSALSRGSYSFWQGCWRGYANGRDTCVGYASQRRTPRHKNGGRHGKKPMERQAQPPSVFAFDINVIPFDPHSLYVRISLYNVEIRFMLKRINKGVILWQKSAPGRISGNVLIIRIPASAS